jgi:hypothetical protein
MLKTVLYVKKPPRIQEVPHRLPLYASYGRYRTITRILVPLKSPTVVSLQQNSLLRKRIRFPLVVFYMNPKDCCCEGARQ